MRVYIAGPITGTTDYEDRFKAVEISLFRAGHKAINPVSICAKMGPDARHEEYMKKCLPFLLEAEGIYLMKNWESSEGAKLEKAVADACGIPVIEIKVLSRKWE